LSPLLDQSSTEPPRAPARLLVLLLVIGAFVAWDQAQEWPVHTNFDSATYVHKAESRGWVYPLLIDLVVPESQQDALGRRGWKQGVPSAFERLVLVQRLIMLAAVGFSSWVASRRGLLVPLAMIGCAALFDAVLARDLFAGTSLWLGSINPESLMFPWVTVLFVLAWGATDSPSRLGLLALGAWGALGVDLAPRLLPFCVMTLAPPAGAWLGRGSGSRAGPALLAPGVCAALVGLRCTATLVTAGVFSPVPFNGFSTIGVALQFADPEDERLFDDRREKEFVRSCLSHPSRGPSDPLQGATRSGFAYSSTKSFVNKNTWKIASPAYDRIWQDARADHGARNRVFADISRTLLFSDGDNFRRWMSWAGKAYARCLAMRWPTTILAFASLAAAVLLRRRAPPPLLALLVLLPLAHVANIVVTVTFQGILPRYVLNGEFLLLGVFGVLAALPRRAERLESPRSSSSPST
jgi:hypothetical protein